MGGVRSRRDGKVGCVKVLLTGIHGFIGHHCALRLLANGHEVLGTDRLTGAISAKEHRICALREAGDVRFVDLNLAHFDKVHDLIAGFRPDVVIHLAAQFPIRHNAEAVQRYVESNVTSWLNVAESCRMTGVPRMVYASSVMARDNGRPSALYGATKSFNEQCAFVYANLGMTTVGLRYAAVYGPEIRRDAASYRIAQDVLADRQIAMLKGFDAPTHMVEISDAAEVTVRLAMTPLAPSRENGPDEHIATTAALEALAASGLNVTDALRHAIAVEVQRAIRTRVKPANAHVFLVAADDDKATMADVAVELARHLGMTAHLPSGFERKPRSGRPDLSKLRDAIGYVPQTTMTQGMRRFAEWLGRQ